MRLKGKYVPTLQGRVHCACAHTLGETLMRKASAKSERIYNISRETHASPRRDINVYPYTTGSDSPDGPIEGGRKAPLKRRGGDYDRQMGAKIALPRESGWFEDAKQKKIKSR